MNKLFSVVLLLLVPLLGAPALEDREQISPVIDESKWIHYSGRSDKAAEGVSALEGMYALLDNSADGLTDSESSALKSELLLYTGLLLIDLGRKERASEVLARGIDLCDREYTRGKGQFFLVQGALLKSHWMLLQKTSVLIKTGGEIQDMTDLALERDDDDFTARLLSAQGLINAPALFGGDPEEAVRLLLSSVRLIQDDFDRFDLYLTLADAFRKQKEWSPAEQWCQKALLLFPENSRALEMQDLIRRRKK